VCEKLFLVSAKTVKISVCYLSGCQLNSVATEQCHCDDIQLGFLCLSSSNEYTRQVAMISAESLQPQCL